MADGAGDILGVAVDAGYNSHEAFTRAFGDQFGVTPAEVRSRGSVGQLALVQPIALDVAPLEIAGPRFETSMYCRSPDSTAGTTGSKIPRACPASGSSSLPSTRIRGRVSATAYGVCFNLDDEGSMDYLCGVQVAAFGAQPSQLACLRVPRQKYAVFVHSEHIAGIRRTWDAIWNGWLPRSGHTVTDAPLLERYDDALQPQSGRGGFSLLIPLSGPDMKLSSVLPIGVVLAMTLSSTTVAADPALQAERFGVYLRVESLERSRAFYERVLGKQPYVRDRSTRRLRRRRCAARAVCESQRRSDTRPQRRAVHPREERGCRACEAQGTGRAAARCAGRSSKGR